MLMLVRHSKISAIIHGVFMLYLVLSIPFLLNKIPMATLAAVRLIVGYINWQVHQNLNHFWAKENINS